MGGDFVRFFLMGESSLTDRCRPFMEDLNEPHFILISGGVLFIGVTVICPFILMSDVSLNFRFRKKRCNGVYLNLESSIALVLQVLGRGQNIRDFGKAYELANRSCTI